jgi:hypothetical protein
LAKRIYGALFDTNLEAGAVLPMAIKLGSVKRRDVLRAIRQALEEG